LIEMVGSISLDRRRTLSR